MNKRQGIAFIKLRHHLYLNKQIVLKWCNKSKADLIMDIRNILLNFSKIFDMHYMKVITKS